jgi:hypothetical protein
MQRVKEKGGVLQRAKWKMKPSKPNQVLVYLSTTVTLLALLNFRFYFIMTPMAYYVY